MTIHEFPINFTSINLPKITESCFQWCQEQGVVHQSNIDITNLGVIVFAMFALLAYNLSVEFADEICRETKLSKDTLRVYGHILVYFAFMLLAVFIIYYTVFN